MNASIDASARRKRSLRAAVPAAAGGMALYFAFVSFGWEAFRVPSMSMFPTLHVGDYDIATRWAYLRWARSGPPATPHRGDMIVFRWSGDRSQKWVKRVIGLPGDTVIVKNGVPKILGRAATQVVDDGTTGICGDEGPCQIVTETLPDAPPHEIALDPSQPTHRDAGPFVVPQGLLLVLGDNRDHSADSRISTTSGGAGLVAMDDVLGRVNLVALNLRDRSRFLLRR